MKKTFFLVLILALSCNSDKTKVLYGKYENELKKGNQAKAEDYLDDIINDNQDNLKYVKLKIPLLLNRCKKEEALKLIDKVLESDKSSELILLKILLLSEESTQKKKLIEDLKGIYVQNMQSNHQRNSTIANLIFLYKLEFLAEDDIKRKFSNYRLNQKEKEIFDNYIGLSTKEYTDAILNCDN